MQSPGDWKSIKNLQWFIRHWGFLIDFQSPGLCILIAFFHNPILEGSTMGWFDGFSSSNGVLQSGVGGMLKI